MYLYVYGVPTCDRRMVIGGNDNNKRAAGKAGHRPVDSPAHRLFVSVFFFCLSRTYEDNDFDKK